MILTVRSVNIVECECLYKSNLSIHLGRVCSRDAMARDVESPPGARRCGGPASKSGGPRCLTPDCAGSVVAGFGRLTPHIIEGPHDWGTVGDALKACIFLALEKFELNA